jgi:hypothetical protein
VEVALHDAQSVKALAQWEGEVGESTPERLTKRLRTVKREEQTALSLQEFTWLDRFGKKPAGSEAIAMSAGDEKGRSRCLSNRLREWKNCVVTLWMMSQFSHLQGGVQTFVI